MISPKMRRVMRWVMVAAATPGHELTMNELVALEGRAGTPGHASKPASKQAMQSTVRLLEERGFLSRHYETRLGRVRVYFLPAGKAASYFPL